MLSSEVASSGLSIGGELVADVAIIGVVVVRGVVEAKRIPAPFLIKGLILESCVLGSVRMIGEAFFEWSRLDRMGPLCTEEENYGISN